MTQTEGQKRRKKRDEATAGDALQLGLFSDTILQRQADAENAQPQKEAELTEICGVPLTTAVFCPFCLATDMLSAFIIQIKKGVSTARGECPRCHNGMKMKTLLTDWTGASFAEFVYDYKKSGYWKKVSDTIGFEKWRERLSGKGREFSGPFWEQYKICKALDPSIPADQKPMTKEDEDLYNSYATSQQKESAFPSY